MRKVTLMLPLLSALLMGMSQDALRQDMVMLDKIYIAALAALRAALDAGDRAKIAKAAAAVKPNFAAPFMLFGNFRPYGP